MSVLHLSHASAWRGGENQIRLLLSHLAEPWRGRLGVPAGSELARRLSSLVPVDPMRCGGLLDPASVLAVRRLVRRHGIRVLHAHDGQSHMTAALASIGLGVPIVVSRRNAFATKGGWKFGRADRFAAVSRAAAMTLENAGVAAARITVVPDAVDFAALDTARPERLDHPDDECLVLCVASFAPEKGHAILLDAWAKVEAVDQTAVLLLAGDGRLQAEMRGRAAALGLKRLRFLGWRDDVASLIRGADIVVASSLAEGLGSALCEAQAAGAPVAATTAGGIPEAVDAGRTGLLAPPGDSGALAENLLRLIANEGLRREMGTAARARARELFDPAAIAERHAEIYRSLAG